MTERIASATTDYVLRDQERMKAAQRYFAWQARIARRELGRRVVEVGCGVGNFTRHLLDRELVVAMDVEAECVAQLVRNLEAPANLMARQMDVVDPAFVELREHGIDSIVCMNVLEHVRDDCSGAPQYGGGAAGRWESGADRACVRSAVWSYRQEPGALPAVFEERYACAGVGCRFRGADAALHEFDWLHRMVGQRPGAEENGTVGGSDSGIR